MTHLQLDAKKLDYLVDPEATAPSPLLQVIQIYGEQQARCDDDDTPL